MPSCAFITDQHIDRSSRWDEQQRLMAWSVDKLRELRPDVIAFGGDLWERRPNIEELRAAARWVMQLADIAPVVGVRGNHDPEGLLPLFNRLRAAYPIHFTDAPDMVQAGGVELCLLPWPRKAQLMAAVGAGGEQARQVGVELLHDVLRGMGERGAVGPRCFVGHVQVRGARVSTGQPLRPGADFELGTEDLALARCDAYLLGHIHLPQEYSASGRPCMYGGSWRRTAYGEVELKSIVVVELSDDRELVPVVQRIPIPCAPMVLLEDEWNPDDPCGPWTVGGYDGDESLQGADVRFRYRVAADQRQAAALAAEHVQDRLLSAGAREVKLDPVPVPTTRARAPEVAEATTLPDKLRAYWRARNDEPPEERQQRLLGGVTELEAACDTST